MFEDFYFGWGFSFAGDEETLYILTLTHSLLFRRLLHAHLRELLSTSPLNSTLHALSPLLLFSHLLKILHNLLLILVLFQFLVLSISGADVVVLVLVVVKFDD